MVQKMNEIRDYIERAPKRFSFNGTRMLNHSHTRLRWLSELAYGTIDDKINRRAGITPAWRPFWNPIQSAIRRNKRRQLQKSGFPRSLSWLN